MDSQMPPGSLPVDDAPARASASGHDLALVLSGGGARGLAHIGVLQVVEALALPVDLVVGVSMGGIVAACYAAGLSTDQMIELTRAMRVGDIFRPRPGRLQLVDGAGISAAVWQVFGDRRFSDLDRELVIVSSSVTSGEHYVIRDGLLADALVASCSIPLIFPPVTVDGHQLVDGGMIDGGPPGPDSNQPRWRRALAHLRPQRCLLPDRCHAHPLGRSGQRAALPRRGRSPCGATRLSL